jgi:sugar phosphate isomerase/epimerase
MAQQPASSAQLSLSRFTVAGCCLTNLGFEGTLQKILDLGFSGVEIATFVEKPSPAGDTYPFAVVDQLSDAEKARLKSLVRRFSHLSTHLPYYPDFRPVSADTAIRERSRKELFRSVNDSGYWGASVATVHVVSEPGVSYRDARADLIRFYRELGDRAAQYGMRLAIETTAPYRVAEYLDLVESVSRDNVGATVDLGHVRFFREDAGVADADRGSPRGIRRYNDLLLEISKSLGPKLYHVHINDVRASDWQDHHVPGTGIVDFVRFFRYLDSSGYAGLLTAEILHYTGSQAAGLVRARDVLRDVMTRT